VDTGGIGDVFVRAGCRGWLCALDIEGPGEFAFEGDTAVIAASVFKVLMAVEFLLPGGRRPAGPA
jgi:beta-lactamase class A